MRIGLVVSTLFVSSLCHAIPRLKCEVKLTGATTQNVQCESALRLGEKVKLVEIEKPCHINFGVFSLVSEIQNISEKLSTTAVLRVSILRNGAASAPKKGVDLVHSTSVPLMVKGGALSSAMMDQYVSGYEYTESTHEGKRYTRLDYKCGIVE